MGLFKTTMPVFFGERLQCLLQSDLWGKNFWQAYSRWNEYVLSLITFQSFCETCQKDVVLNRSALQKCELNYNSWPQFVSAIQMSEPILTSIAHSKFVFIEFSPELTNVIKLYKDIYVGQSKCKLSGMVRSHNRHFTCAVLIEGKWTYIDDLCSGVKQFSNLAELTKHFVQG